MKSIPEYYIKALELAAESNSSRVGKFSRLPDINTPHGYLMRSRVAARPNGGLWLVWFCNREDRSFAGMGGITAESLDVLKTRIRGAYNRQHKGGTSYRSLELLRKRARG
ncbi:hypothetical protein [Providencia phage vB_PreS-PatoteraRojo]|nr:hypothetical protein [Providencia phage vB_PreS-PatoteraRojo]